MLELLEIPGGILAVGFAFRLLNWRPKPKEKKPDFVVCGCGHGMHDHDPETNQCHARVRVYEWNEDMEKETLKSYADCTCRQFL